MAATGDPEILPVLGHEDAVGNAHTFSAAELDVFFLHLAPMPLELAHGIVGGMDVGGAIVDRDLIGELPPRRVVLHGQFELADDTAGVAYAKPGRRRQMLEMLATGNVFPVELGIFHCKLASGDHALRNL